MTNIDRAEFCDSVEKQYKDGAITYLEMIRSILDQYASASDDTSIEVTDRYTGPYITEISFRSLIQFEMNKRK